MIGSIDLDVSTVAKSDKEGAPGRIKRRYSLLQFGFGFSNGHDSPLPPPGGDKGKVLYCAASLSVACRMIAKLWSGTHFLLPD